MTDTNTDPSRPVLLAKDARGAAATKCHSLKFSVIFISYSAHGNLTAVWFRAQESGRSHAAEAQFKLKPLFLMDDPWPPLTSCNYVALLKCPCQGSRRVASNLSSALAVASLYDLLSISCLRRLTARALEAWQLRLVSLSKSGHERLFLTQTTEEIVCLFAHADQLLGRETKLKGFKDGGWMLYRL